MYKKEEKKTLKHNLGNCIENHCTMNYICQQFNKNVKIRKTYLFSLFMFQFQKNILIFLFVNIKELHKAHIDKNSFFYRKKKQLHFVDYYFHWMILSNNYSKFEMKFFTQLEEVLNLGQIQNMINKREIFKPRLGPIHGL